ncbi:carotenoid ester lipase [Fomes fomentarius]|nr:carotenoid ester lipase [Fomes fomentarius]
MLLTALAFAALVPPSLIINAASVKGQEDPTLQLDAATVVGTRNGSVDSFLGIPFAHPPVGDLRLRLPQISTSYNGTINATKLGNQCLGQALPLPPNLPPDVVQVVGPLLPQFSLNPDVPVSEDCLNINIIRPSNLPADAKLPVLFWIYGGGFVLGSNSLPIYNGSAVVQRSIDIGEPIIFVAVNYRLNVFGFLGGKEVKEAGLGNIGLHDQRAGLHWVNRFISAFGGDPSKVTIWGESAGAISVALHMLTNDGNTEGLFRAGIMSSGSLVPTGDIIDLQGTYNFVVDQVGCSRSSDTLACLRTVPADDLVAAANNTPELTSYSGLGIPYMPRADGIFLKEPIPELACKGKLAKIPFIMGDVKDEGTLFSLGILNVTTDDEFADFLRQVWFPGASRADVEPILEAYPSDPAAGSPFDTGNANAITSQYKRIAAVQGDWFFQAQRRTLLKEYASKQPAYSYLSARGNFPAIGDVHGSDLLIAFAGGDLTDYLVRFVNHLDPNGKTGVQWPRYSLATRPVLQFNDGEPAINVTSDIERLQGMEVVASLGRRFPF